MLYKPTNPSPYLTRINAKDSFNIHCDFPKSMVSSYNLFINDTNANKDVYTIENADLNDSALDVVIPKGKLTNGKDYSWRLQYWTVNGTSTVSYNAFNSTPYISRATWNNIFGKNYIMLTFPLTDADRIVSNYLVTNSNGGNIYPRNLLDEFNEVNDGKELHFLTNIAPNVVYSTSDSGRLFEYDNIVCYIQNLNNDNMLFCNLLGEKFIYRSNYTFTDGRYTRNLFTSVFGNCFPYYTVHYIPEPAYSSLYKIHAFDMNQTNTVNKLLIPSDTVVFLSNNTKSLYNKVIECKLFSYSDFQNNIENYTTESDTSRWELEKLDGKVLIAKLKNDVSITSGLECETNTAMITSGFLTSDLYNDIESNASPNYYFSTSSEPVFEISTSFGGNKLSLLSATFRVNYSQSEGIGLNYFKIYLYKYNNKLFEYQLLKESELFTDSKSVLTYEGFVSGEKYMVVASGSDDDGFSISTPELTFTCEYDIENINNVVINSTTNEKYETKALQYDHKLSVNKVFFKYEKSAWNVRGKIYRCCVDEDSMVRAGDILNVSEGCLFNDVFLDYNIKNKKNYCYYIEAEEIFVSDLQYTKTVGEVTESGIISQSDAVEFMVNGGVEVGEYNEGVAMVTITQGEYDDEGNVVATTVATGSLSKVNKIYKTNSTTAEFCEFSILSVKNSGDDCQIKDVFNFGMFSESPASDININIDVDYVGGLNKYDKEIRGNKGYLSSKLVGILSEERTIDEWINFVNSDNTKVLKDFNGKTMVIGIDASSIVPNYLSDKNAYEISFSYKELGTTDNMKIYKNTLVELLT